MLRRACSTSSRQDDMHQISPPYLWGPQASGSCKLKMEGRGGVPVLTWSTKLTTSRTKVATSNSSTLAPTIPTSSGGADAGCGQVYGDLIWIEPFQTPFYFDEILTGCHMTRVAPSLVVCLHGYCCAGLSWLRPARAPACGLEVDVSGRETSTVARSLLQNPEASWRRTA